MSRRAISSKEILSPDRILSNLLKDYVEGALDDYRVFYIATVDLIDHIGGKLAGPESENKKQETPNPKNSIRARVITEGYDKHTAKEDLPVFWPMFPYDTMPLKESEHVLVVFIDPDRKKHGLWISRVPEPNKIHNLNITPGAKKYMEDPNSDLGKDHTAAVEQIVQGLDEPPEVALPPDDFVLEDKEKEIPLFQPRVGDRVIEGSHNTAIILSRDRVDKTKSGEEKEAGTIDLVTGRQNAEGEIDLKEDKSRILLTMKSDVDANFATDAVGKATGPSAAIVVKSDEIRIVARVGMKIVVEGGETRIKSDNVVIDSPEIKIGSENSAESLVLGDAFIKALDTFLTQVNTGATAGLAFGIPGTATMPVVSAAANAFKAQLKNLISKKHKTE